MNGTSTVYEVKSEYDSFDRLASQIADYRKVFDRIVVVTSEAKSDAILDRVEPLVGVTALRTDGSLKTYREPQSNKASTDPATIFDCMRQGERLAAIEELWISARRAERHPLPRDEAYLLPP